MFILSPAARMTLLDDAIAVGGVLNGLTCGLFQSFFQPGVNSTYDEFDAAKATFTGYAVITPITWSGPYQDANQTAYVLGGLRLFEAAAPTPPALFVANTIGGYYLYTGTDLIGFEVLDDPSTGLPAPIPIEDETDVAAVIPRFSFGQ